MYLDAADCVFANITEARHIFDDFFVNAADSPEEQLLLSSDGGGYVIQQQAEGQSAGFMSAPVVCEQSIVSDMRMAVKAYKDQGSSYVQLDVVVCSAGFRELVASGVVGSIKGVMQKDTDAIVFAMPVKHPGVSTGVVLSSSSPGNGGCTLN